MSEYLEELLVEAESSVSSSSTKTRYQAWNLFTSYKGEINETEAQRLVRLIWRTLPLYSDRESRSLIEQVVLILSKESSLFLKTFVVSLFKQTPSFTKESSRSKDKEKLTLFRWFCFALRSGFQVLTSLNKSEDKAENENPEKKSGKGFNMGSFIGVHLNLSSSLLNLTKNTQWKTLWKPLEENFLQFPKLFDEYTDVFFTAVKNGTIHGDLSIPAGLLLRFHLKLPTPNPEYQKQFIELYNKSVINSTAVIEKKQQMHFLPLLESLDRQTFDSVLLPSIDRNSKRNPEYLIPSLSFLFQCLPFSLHSLIVLNQPLVTVFASLLYANNHSLGVEASKLFQVLSTKVCQNAPSLHEINTKRAKKPKNQSQTSLDEQELKQAHEAMIVLFEALRKALSGAKEFSHKNNIFATIGKLSETPLPSKPDLAVTVVNSLAPLVLREGNEEIKLTGLAALAQWFQYINNTNPLDDSLIAFFDKGFADTKESSRSATLNVFHVALLRGCPMNKKLDPLIENLLKLAKTGLTQAPRRSDLIHSLLCLSQLSQTDPSLDQKIEKEGLWTGVLKNDSFVHSLSFLEKSSESTLVSLAKLILSVFEEPSENQSESEKEKNEKKSSRSSSKALLAQIVTSAQPTEPSIMTTITYLLAHSNIRVHQAATQTVEKLIQNSATRSSSFHRFNDSLLVHFHHFIMNSKEAESAVVTESEKENGEANKSKLDIFHIYRQALLTLIQPTLSQDLIPNLILTVHHPVYAYGLNERKTRALWRSVEHRLENLHLLRKRDQIVTASTALNDFLLSEKALFSSNNVLVRSSLHCVSYLATLFPALPHSYATQDTSSFQSPTFDFAHRLSTHFKSLKSQLSSLTDKDLKIFRSPPGEVVVFEEENTGEYKPQVVERKPLKKLKGEKMYGDADEEWAERTRKEIQAKKGEKEPKLTKEQQKQIEIKLAEQNEIREKVKRILSRLDVSLQATGKLWSLSHLSQSNPKTNTASSTAASSYYHHQYPHHGLSLLFDYVLVLLRNPLTLERAAEIVLKLYSYCLDSSFESKKRFMGVTVLRLKTVDRPNPPFPVKKEQIIENVERLLSEAKSITLRLLSPASFTLLLPLFEFAFLQTESNSGQENAMILIELHSKRNENREVNRSLASSDFPRPKLVSLLLKVIETQPRFVQRASIALQRIGEAAQEDELEAFIEALISPHPPCRFASLQALEMVPCLVEQSISKHEVFATRLWISKSDVEPSHVAIADDLWELYQHPLPDDYDQYYFPLLSNPDLIIRKMVGMALATATKAKQGSIQQILTTLFKMYKDACIKEEDIRYTKEDPGKVLRSGVVCVLRGFSTLLTNQELPLVFNFMISSALGDLSEQVRDEMVDTGMEIINQAGKQYVGVILPILESYLAKQPKQDQDIQPTQPINDPQLLIQAQLHNSAAYQEMLVQRQDWTRKSVVILLACIAKHLDSTNDKIKDIIDKLLDALNTPAESVQKAVATCLAPILKNCKEEGERLVKLMLEKLKNGRDYGIRRGAAYGLAGIVKGLGIASLKQFGIMTTLQNCAEDKKHSNARQGALLAYECLWHLLGRLFEPYVIHILPQLLNCFGDPIREVRETTADTARSILGHLSEPGVKLFLPGVLKGLGDRAWRTKTKSIELLGAMAFCAPRQLSLFLPTIVPSLIEVLADSHSKVQEAAKAALKDIGSVIRNPEIQIHVPIILQALDDPNKYTSKCLNDLLHTNFVHVIDAPSLALIMPILNRALRERITGSTASKKQAAQIVGSMCSLTTHKDLIPYLGTLIPELKVVLYDPIPEIRGVASKSLGSLVRGMGAEYFADLVPQLLQEMQSDLGTVERAGSAQGLSEVLAALDVSVFETKLTELLALTNNPKPNVREGALSFFVFCPSTFHEDLEPYLPRILPSVLRGLSDEVEMVREVSMKAAQSIVNEFAFSALELLLPALQDGLFSPNWRIRHSSIGLLGDMLHKISGTKSPSAPDSDGSMTGTQEQSEAIIKALGFERRNRILAALYIIRSDLNITVRQKSLAVWKSVVDNTPKTLRQMLPILTTMIIDCLGNDSDDAEKTQVARRCMGDTVKKLGERILPEILPLLEKAYTNGGIRIRQGVCLGLSEILSASSRAHIVNYLDSIIPLVQKGLCADREEVSSAAAEAFDMLCSCSMKSIEQILPPLVAQIGGPNSQVALQGLQQMLQYRAKVILPSLIPKLLEAPIEAEKARILAQMSSVCGPALNAHIPTIIVSMITAEKPSESPEESAAYSEEIHASLIEILTEVNEPDGIQLISSELISLTKSSDSTLRGLSAKILGQYAQAVESYLDQEIYESFLIALTSLYTDSIDTVISSAVDAMQNICQGIDKDSQVLYISLLKTQFSGFYSQGLRKKETAIPGFSFPKALSPIIPFFLTGLVTCPKASIKQESAEALGEIISMTPSNPLKPYVNQIIGPLIRVVADKVVTSEVKESILQTLIILLEKSGPSLKAFASPLQTTLIKLLQDPSSSVRILSGRVLAKLIGLAKVEMILNDLINSIQTADSGLRETYYYAIVAVLFNLRKKLDDITPSSAPADTIMLKVDPTKWQRVFDTAKSQIDIENTASPMQRIYLGKIFGLYGSIHKNHKEIIETFLSDFLNQLSELNQEGPQISEDWNLLHTYILSISYTLKYCTVEIDSKLLKQLAEEMRRIVVKTGKFEIAQATCDILTHLVNHIYDMTGNVSENPISSMILESFAAFLAGSEADIRVKSLIVKNLTKIGDHVNISTKTVIPILSSALISQIKEAQRMNNTGYKHLLDHCLFALFNLKTNAYDFNSYIEPLDSNSNKFFSDYQKRFLVPNKMPPALDANDSDQEEHGLID